MSVRGLVMAAAGAAVPAVSGFRYWRIFIASNNGGANIAMNEISLRTSLGGATVTNSVTPCASSSNFSSFVVTNTVSGSTADYWFGNSSANEWAAYDLLTARTLVQLAIYPHVSNITMAPNSFKVQGSNSSLSGPWTDVQSFTATGGWAAGVWREFLL